MNSPAAGWLTEVGSQIRVAPSAHVTGELSWSVEVAELAVDGQS